MKKLIVVDISPKAYTVFHEHLDLINVMLSVDFKNVKTYTEIDKQLKKSPITDKIKTIFIKEYLQNKSTVIRRQSTVLMEIRFGRD